VILSVATLAALAPWEPEEPGRLASMLKARARVVLGPPPEPNRKRYPYEGTIDFQGMRILVENAKGSTRSGVTPDGTRWETTMRAHYGEFADTVGMDGDPVDVFVGRDAGAPVAYVVHQKHPGTQVPDEDKVILGCRTAAEAQKLYRAHYDRGGFFHGITPWPVAELAAELKRRRAEGERLDRPPAVRMMVKARPGLVLRPSKKNPAVRRWVREGQPEAAQRRPTPVKAPMRPRSRAARPERKPAAPSYNFDWSKASEADVRKRGKRITGRDVSPAELAEAAGILPGCRVQFAPDRFDMSAMRVRAWLPGQEGPDGTWLRQFNGYGDGKGWIENIAHMLPPEMRGNGAGTAIFARQVEAAARLGFEEIEAEGFRSPLSDEWVGYYVWPRLGYDAPLPRGMSGYDVPGNARRLSQLMATPEGRAWWKEHGRTTNMRFKLEPDSKSRRVLDNYVAAKRPQLPKLDGVEKMQKAKVKASAVGEFPAGAQHERAPSLDEADDAMLDRVWDDLSAAPSTAQLEGDEPMAKGKGQTFAKPKGDGWEPIPKGRKGGYRRRKAASGWEYWYADQHAHPVDAKPGAAPVEQAHRGRGSLGMGEHRLRLWAGKMVSRGYYERDGALEWDVPHGGLTFELAPTLVQRPDGTRSRLRLLGRKNLDVRDGGRLGGTMRAAAYEKRGPKFDHQVIIDLPERWTHGREKLEQEIRRVLAHETTHALDPAVERREAGSSTLDHEGGYANEPSEVTARKHEILRDLNTPEVKEWLAKQTDGYVTRRSPPEPDEDAYLQKRADRLGWSAERLEKERVARKAKHDIPWMGGPRPTAWLVEKALREFSQTWRVYERRFDAKSRRALLTTAARALVAHHDGTSKPMKKARSLLIKGAQKPPGMGWSLIQGSKHGGWHRQKAGGGYEHWYPSADHAQRDIDHFPGEYDARIAKYEETGKRGWKRHAKRALEALAGAKREKARHSAGEEHPAVAREREEAKRRPRDIEVDGIGYVQVTDHDEALSRVRSMLGKGAGFAEALRCAGVPHGSEPRITIGQYRGSPSVEIKTTGRITMERRIHTDHAGNVVIYNERVWIPPAERAKGLGLKLFAGQVEAATAAGVARIECQAGGSARDLANGRTDYIGFYVWPRLGYDGDVPEELQGKLGATRVSEIMRTPDGRKAWKAHGDQFDATFDLSEGSTSRRVLGEYIKGKGVTLAKGDGAAPPRGKGETPPTLSEADEALLDRIWANVGQLRKAAPLRLLIKATIKTPKGSDGKVDYGSVPVGASIWVTVTSPSSPLHGRPILITKRPDHQFALTGGAGSKHIQGRRHLTMQGGEIKASERDEAAHKERQEAEARNAPKKAAIKKLRGEAKKAQKAAEDDFMEAVGIKKRGLSKQDREEVHEAARKHAEGLGMEDKEANSFAKKVADGIAKKDRERRKKQAGRRMQWAEFIAQGESQEDAEAMVGPDVAPLAMTAPHVDADEWAGMSEPERELAVNQHLDQQEAAAEHEAGEGMRFEDDGAGEGENLAPEDAEPFAGLEEGAESLGGDDTPTAEETETPADLGSHEGEPEPEPEPETPEGPAFTVGHEEPEEEVEPEKPAKPILTQEKASEAVEKFREFAVAKKAEKEIRAHLEELPEVDLAAPSAVEELRLRAGVVDDDELSAFLGQYNARNRQGSDDGFYSALTPHWNEHIGNKLNGSIVTGASAAITGLVGEELSVRYDVQRLVDALGPETAAMAVVARMREEMTPAAFRDFVSKTGDHNVKNQRKTERAALTRHHELERQAEDLEKQVKSGDLQSEATIAMLRARNLLQQRENLGGALGSMQASAAVYHFGEEAQAARWRKSHPVTINVGSKMALEDKRRRLGRFKGRTAFHPVHGYQIHTTVDGLRKFVMRTEQNKADAAKWQAVKFDDGGITHDDEGREWTHDYKVHGFRTHFPHEDALPADMKHLAGKPISFMADQRNNIEWIAGSGGGLVKMRTGGGKTLVSIGVAGKMLGKRPDGRHLRVVPDGREQQWAQEIRNFTDHNVVVLPGKSKKEERHRILAAAPKGSIVVVGHTNAGRYDHAALAESHEWDSIGVDEPQELRSKSGSGKMSAGAKRIFKIPAANRHALTATPATDHPVEAYDIVNWSRPGVLGYRSRFSRSFAGFGGGTNAQDAALQKSLYSELEPHLSANRAVSPHYAIDHHERPVTMSHGQLEKQREIESRVQGTIDKHVQAAYDKKRAGTRGYENKSWVALKKTATEKAMKKMTAEHRANLGGGDTSHNPKLAELQRTIGGSSPSERHVVFVDSTAQRRAVANMVRDMGRTVHNIDTSARGATRKVDGKTVGAIELRKRDWKGSDGGTIIIDRTSASGHNLAEGHHLHVLGDPDDAAQMLQAHGRLGRSNREGDFAIHTYRYSDSPFAHNHWNRLNQQVKVLKATAPDLFVEGRKREAAPQQMMAKGRRLVVRSRG